MSGAAASGVAAVMVVRDEVDIVGDSIGHLLALGVDRVLVADNGSTDGTTERVRRIAARDPRVEWHDADGPFAQGDVTSRLAERARAGGATWILPNDADEFLDPGPGGLAALTAPDAPHAPVGGIDIGEIGAWEIPVRNFVQCRALRGLAAGAGAGRNRFRAIDTMVFAARPIGTHRDARRLVETGALPFIRTAYPPKLVFRAAAGLRIHAGAHGADGVAGRTVRHPVATLLHAPIRTPDGLRRRRHKGARIEAIATDHREGWHLRRLIALDEASLAAEWRANTTATGWPPARAWALDLRLRRIGRGLAAFRRALEHG